MLIPKALSTLTDHHPEVRAALKYRAYELYGLHPKGTVSPASYPFNWRAPRPFTEGIKESIQPYQRCRRAPRQGNSQMVGEVTLKAVHSVYEKEMPGIAKLL